MDDGGGGGGNLSASGGGASGGGAVSFTAGSETMGAMALPPVLREAILLDMGMGTVSSVRGGGGGGGAGGQNPSAAFATAAALDADASDANALADTREELALVFDVIAPYWCVLFCVFATICCC